MKLAIGPPLEEKKNMEAVLESFAKNFGSNSQISPSRLAWSSGKNDKFPTPEQDIGDEERMT